jgi:drug/metabolite transporter (DMT)-like permease
VRLVITTLLALATAAPPASQPASRPGKTAADLLTDTQLPQQEQALGWWLGGAGTIGLAAGVFALYLADRSSPGPTRDLEYATGVTFVGLGAAVLVAGIYTMAAKDPGPCETDGTALSAVIITPAGVVARF